jgi:arginyl-tRNA synthetase
MIRKDIKKLLGKAFLGYDLGADPFVDDSEGTPLIPLDIPESSSYGDYSTSIVLPLAKEILARRLAKSPRELAEKIVLKIKNKKQAAETFKKIEVAGPGFINFFLSPKYLQKQVAEILRQKEKYGSLDIGKGQKAQVEFISANPTGPLTVGNARGGFWGDVLGNVLGKAGFKTEKAYYINNYGMQVLTLGHSVLKDSEAKYKGDYIDRLNQEIKEKDAYRAGEKAAKSIIEELIKKTVEKMGIKFDEWIFETWLYQTGRVKKALAVLGKKELLYEKDEATWFKSLTFGDQRDRVVVKKNDWYTYLAGDAGLHYYKFTEKKFDKVINIWGADHFGDVAGLKAVVEALGHKGKLDIILLQFVTLLEKGEKLKMSKRAGVFVTMDELLDIVGRDVARFFFLQKSADTHLNFDVELAKEQSEKNPVYYVQYAYARICSILKNYELGSTKKRRIDFSKLQTSYFRILNHPSELTLIKQLIRLPEVVEDTARDYQVQRLPQYALDLATVFHQFYRDCRVIGENKDLTKARLALIQATQIVIKNTLDLMGISSPEKM